MTEPAVVHNTFVVDRHYPTTPRHVFTAFSDEAKKRRWCVEGDGFTIDSFDMDFRVGGMERSRFRMGDGPTIAINAQYHDIVPDRRIVFVYEMSVAGQSISWSLTTIELLAAEGGTHLVFTEQGAFLGGADSAIGRKVGCQSLLEELAKELKNHA